MKKFTLITFLVLHATLLSAQLNPWFIGGKIWEWPNSWTNMSVSYPEGYDIVYDYNGDVLLMIYGNYLLGADGAVTPNTYPVSIGGSLIIDESSTQSTLFVPHPYDSNIYYLFSTPADMSGNTYYSKIDLSLNSGNGDVVLNEKNVLLFNGGSEKIAVTWNPSQTGIWVLLHETGNNNFRAYLIDSSGLNASSYQTTSIGSIIDTSNVAGARGEMTFSVSGTQVACALGNGSVEIFDFNITTGILSSPRILTDSDLYAPYGVAFSPMEDFLYTSDRNTGAVLQFNLDLPDSLIALSKVILFDPVTPMLNQQIGGCLELELHSLKIYQARYLKSRLGVINYPDSLGTSCDYDTTFIIGSNIANAGISGLGLPNTVPPVLFSTGDLIEPTVLEPCQSGLVELIKPYNYLADSIIWYLNYPSTDTAFIRMTYGDTLIFEYPEPGTYTIYADNYYNSNVFTNMGFVNITLTPELELGNDTSLCPGNSIEIDLSSLSSFYYYDTAVYHWHFSTQNGVFDAYDSIFTITEAGNYFIDIYSPFSYLNCPVSDSLIVTYSTDTLDLGSDLILPQISNYPLTAPVGYISYNWSTGETSNSINLSSSGSYWLNVLNQDGCLEQDTINIVELSNSLIISPTIEPITCHNDCDASITVMPSGGIPPYSLNWSTGDTLPSINGLCTGDYYLTITNNTFSLSCPWTIASSIGGATIMGSMLYGEIGDTIGAFFIDSLGNYICCGLTDIYNNAGAFHMFNLHEDDPSTPQKDGCSDLDIIYLKVFRFGDGTIENLTNVSLIYAAGFYFPTYFSGSCWITINDYLPSSNQYQCIKQYHIDNPPAINLSINYTDIECYNGSTDVIFTASGGYQPYIYMPSNMSYNAGQYLVSVIDSMYCMKTETLTIEQPDELILSATHSPIICNGDSTLVTFTATGGTPPYILPDNANYIAGTYSDLIASDVMNCMDSIDLIIEEPDEIVIDTLIAPASFVTANDGMIELTVSGGIPPYQFLWNTGDQTEDLMNLAFGYYWVELSDSIGCLRADTFLVPFIQLIRSNEDWNITIHPNPTTSVLYIDNLESNSTIGIFNLLGELILSKKIEGAKANINVSDFLPGYYIIKITGQLYATSKRFEVVR